MFCPKQAADKECQHEVLLQLVHILWLVCIPESLFCFFDTHNLIFFFFFFLMFLTDRVELEAFQVGP